MIKLLFGFNSCFENLNKNELRKVNKLVNVDDKAIVKDYENKFVSITGKGYGFSLASGRMAFYLLLKHLNIGKADEVLVVGFTCSVMINAILRVGATPIYSDVSPLTFGSDAKSIKDKISVRTKMIVAQHSFGIPCDIEKIARLGKLNKIFVLEDCALALGSEIKGIKVGNFGDAAIFSTDHSKPLNTLIGGFFYTRNEKLYNTISKDLESIPELSKNQKKNLFKQLLFEKKWHSPNKYKYAKWINILHRIRKKIAGKKLLFMDGDNGPPHLIKPQYPYPAKLPTFLAQVGIYELNIFDKERNRRKEILEKYLITFSNSEYKNDISSVYFDEHIDINPLRFVFTSKKASELKNQLSLFIDFSQIWFRKPIIATSFDLSELKYKKANCPIAESIGKTIINFPCIIPEEFEDSFFKLLGKQVLNKH